MNFYKKNEIYTIFYVIVCIFIIFAQSITCYGHCIFNWTHSKINIKFKFLLKLKVLKIQ